MSASVETDSGEKSGEITATPSSDNTFSFSTTTPAAPRVIQHDDSAFSFNFSSQSSFSFDQPLTATSAALDFSFLGDSAPFESFPVASEAVAEAAPAAAPVEHIALPPVTDFSFSDSTSAAQITALRDTVPPPQPSDPAPFSAPSVFGPISLQQNEIADTSADGLRWGSPYEVDIWNSQGAASLLCYAADHGDLALVQRVLERAPTFDVNSAVSYKFQRPTTPLAAACRASSIGNEGDRLRIMALLLERKADPNARGMSESAPLHFVGTVKYAEVLVNAKANLNAVDELGRTPLMNHAASSNIHVLRFLLDCGADPLLERRDGKPALSMAVLSLADEVLRGAMRRVLLGAISESPSGAEACGAVGVIVSYIVLSSQEEAYKSESAVAVATLMLETSWDVAAIEAVRNLAEKPTHTAFIQSALTAALWPQLSNSSSYTTSCRVEMLILLKADVNAVNEEGDHPLHKCANDVRILKPLLAAKADVNALSRSGSTALWDYCRFSRNDLIKPLLEAKADANISGSDSRSTYEMADYTQKGLIRDSILAAILPIVSLFLSKDTAGLVCSFLAPPVPPIPAAGERVMIKARRPRAPVSAAQQPSNSRPFLNLDSEFL